MTAVKGDDDIDRAYAVLVIVICVSAAILAVWLIRG